MRYAINSDLAPATAGAVTGALATADVDGDYTLHVTCSGLTTGKKALIAIEDTANAGPDPAAFADARQVAVFHLQGPIVEHIAVSWRAYQLGSARVGAAANKLRLNLLAVDATPGLAIAAELEY